MRRVITLVMVLSLVGFAFAADSDDITINYTVSAINEINIDDDDVTLNITSATAGLVPEDATASTTYDVTTNVSGSKITAVLDGAMETGLTLSMNATAPTGGLTEGETTLSTSAADVVTGMSGCNEADINIDFTLAATAGAAAATSSKTLTLTVTE